MTKMFEITPPSMEQQVERLIAYSGFHDAESIPKSKVVEMIVAFCGHQQKVNEHLLKLMDEFNRISVTPICITLSKDESND